MYTAARYYRPSGRGVQLVGIEPDLPVAPPVPEKSERIVLREEDMFPTALPRERDHRTASGAGRADSLAACIADDGLAKKRAKRHRKERRASDHALLIAQDHLVCRLRHPAA